MLFSAKLRHQFANTERGIYGIYVDGDSVLDLSEGEQVCINRVHSRLWPYIFLNSVTYVLFISLKLKPNLPQQNILSPY